MHLLLEHVLRLHDEMLEMFAPSSISRVVVCCP